ncbi:MAG: fluoride efflux transporter CrcB [Steroidobacteraceae bacterium]
MKLAPVAYLVAVLGSALGGGARLWVSTLVARGFGTDFPWGTLAVNLLGCFTVGLLGALFAPIGRVHVMPLTWVFLVVGVLGGFTTFSAFSLEALLLVQRGATAAAAAYVAVSLLGCLTAAGAGWAIAATVR